MAPSKPAAAIRRSIQAAVEFGRFYPLSTSEKEHQAVYANWPYERKETYLGYVQGPKGPKR